MATTPRGIVYPTTSNAITPLASVFASLATSADTAIGVATDALEDRVAAFKGLAANMGAAGDEGRTYYATDTNRTWFDNGSAWIQIDPAVLFAATSTSVASGADVKVDFDDPGNLPTGITWNETTKEINMANAGRYKITTTGRFQNNGTGWRVITIRKNGTIVTQFSVPSVSGVEVAGAVIAITDVVASDKITVVVTQNSGATLSFVGAQIALERL